MTLRGSVVAAMVPEEGVLQPAYEWTFPHALPVRTACVRYFSKGESVQLLDDEDQVLATLLLPLGPLP
ncbi:MAG TPA: hypothetical protein VJX92_18915 [Methylomirabilota bacterium]|nr:hypothetical protein [Methylomirabilota bacterium]